jgi:hypothetical protein
MKKIVLFFLFCSLALFCYSQETSKIIVNNEVTPIYSGFSLQYFGLGNSLGTRTTIFGHQLMNTTLSNNSSVWESANYKIINYSDYDNKSFSETKIGPWICIIAGTAAMIIGPLMSATSDSSSTTSHLPGIIVFSFGAGAVAGGLIWLFSD